MSPMLAEVTIAGYVCATALALWHLVQPRETSQRLAALVTAGAWVVHTLSLTVRTVQTGRPPLDSLADALWAAVWVVVLVEMMVERQGGVKVLGAFVLPVVVLLGLRAAAVGPGPLGPEGARLWIWVHIGLALVGIAAFVLNFAGALMYLLQERQLKGKRPGAFYYRLPPLETLDHLAFRTLALGFPFLTAGLLLGALAAGPAVTFDPLVVLSLVAWTIYAATLAGRAAGGWHGRRAAYSALVGFAALVLTLGAGLVLPGRHG